jgi:hypothetical protein
LAAASFFPTDMHNGTLGEGENADTLTRLDDIKGELVVLWGRQDPHIPNEGLLAPMALYMRVFNYFLIFILYVLLFILIYFNFLFFN